MTHNRPDAKLINWGSKLKAKASSKQEEQAL